MRQVISSLAIIGMSLALLWYFSMIWIYGRIEAGEPNLLIRGLETGLLMALLIFGIIDYILKIKKVKNAK